MFHHIFHSYWWFNILYFQFGLDFYRCSLVREVISTLPPTCEDAECSPLIQFSLRSVTFRSSLTRLTATFFMAHMLYGAFLHFSILAQKHSLPSNTIRQQRSIMGDMQLSVSSFSLRDEMLMTRQFWSMEHDCDICWWQEACDYIFYASGIIFGRYSEMFDTCYVFYDNTIIIIDMPSRKVVLLGISLLSLISL